ncbi:MAG: stage III sporulation protein AG [Lachnospiraceae bacterium]|nr:stage III sporulation protein AG [Lachnospiraceae bacterium]
MGQEEKPNRKSWWKDLGKNRLFLLIAACLGLLLLILPGSPGTGSEKTQKEAKGDGLSGAGEGSERAVTGSGGTSDYAKLLENRLKDVLSSVEGVGQADVMITLKTSEESVFQTDENVSSNRVKESDSGGGSRESEESRTEKSTVLTGGSSGGEPYLVRQIMPRIEGVVVICEGGDIPAVKTEICEAVGALFDVPVHKIKVLKRVSGKP